MEEKQQQQQQQKVHENKGSFSDPTSNVLMLVEAATKRQDDLSALRHELSEKLIEARLKRLDDMQQLRAYYEKELRVAEKERIDAIREVDVQARKSSKK